MQSHPHFVFDDTCLRRQRRKLAWAMLIVFGCGCLCGAMATVLLQSIGWL